MILYHGSTGIIESPVFGAGNPHNDYGQGFYCTESEEMAKEWACGDDCDGFANKYELQTDGLELLNLNSDRYNILNWLAVLLANRTFDLRDGLSVRAKEFLLSNFLPDISSADIIIGYRADDSYFTFAKDFLSGALSLERLQVAMRLGLLGEQVFIKTQKAFDNIRFVEALPAERDIYFPKYSARDAKARRDYRSISSSGSPEFDTFIIDILRNAGIR